MACKQYYTSFSLVVTRIVLLTVHANDPRGLGEVDDLCEKADFKNLCRDTLHSTGTRIRSCSGCSHSYDAAITDLKKALESLKKEDMESLMISLSMVIEDYGSCDDMYVDGPVKSHVGSANKAMIQMAGNCFALASLIQF
ncbi:hypothetical protein SLEP1_g32744 [Rubroshorea leprosula]|uniref:Pectinesterase inhibitor domain-containing protein n=1 Tax=Rubroshorea leprosula TaxID=152421 RepID=A0AAV5KEJ0_9ROSI|nr:hypothetical protein SLEP1_g32744 [Rubroshorea leprosula]